MQGWTPLMSAVSANRELLVQLLLDHAADVQATNSSGQTALHYAVRPDQSCNGAGAVKRRTVASRSEPTDLLHLDSCTRTLHVIIIDNAYIEECTQLQDMCRQHACITHST